jgi:hypothetical protein
MNLTLLPSWYTPSRFFSAGFLVLTSLLATSCLFATFACASTVSSTIRSFTFHIEQRYAALRSTLPEHTSIYNEYPREELRTKLPEYLSMAAMKEDESSEGSNSITESSYILMGRPIHILQNDILQLNIINKLQSTGLSIHFHGFEMEDAFEYDGVVGMYSYLMCCWYIVMYQHRL